MGCKDFYISTSLLGQDMIKNIYFSISLISEKRERDEQDNLENEILSSKVEILGSRNYLDHHPFVVDI